jgi:hypothetical protein
MLALHSRSPQVEVANEQFDNPDTVGEHFETRQCTRDQSENAFWRVKMKAGKQSGFHFGPKQPDIEVNKPHEVKFWQRPNVALVLYV